MMRNFPTIDLLCFIGTKYFVLGIDGKELATYTNNSLDEWYVWGTDMTGKIKGNTKYYFFKDHLGSVRAIVDNNYTLVSAFDYDMWGYLLESRVYNSDSAKHKFTGKERDEENLYDYFGARYYNAKIGSWGQVEPLINKYLDLSPYVNSLNNPIIIIDPNGKDPIREQIGSQNSVIEILKANIGKSIYDVGLDIFGKDAGINSRYIYTKERGILDLQHFFAAAHQSKEWGFDVALRRGEAQEFAQLFGIFDKRSAFNPEDLSSNLQGAILGKLLESTELTSDNIEIIIEFLNSLEIIDPNDPSISESKVYIPSLEEYKAGIRLPLRYTYGPYYGEAVGFNNR